MKIGPLLVMWNVHWNIRGTEDWKAWGFYDPSNDQLDFNFIYKYTIASTMIYAVWAIPYFLLVPITSQKYGEIPVIKEIGPAKGKLYFLMFHYFIFLASGLTTGLTAYFYQPIHVLIILIVSCISFWNGGKYYMEYFGRKYEGTIVTDQNKS